MYQEWLIRNNKVVKTSREYQEWLIRNNKVVKTSREAARFGHGKGFFTSAAQRKRRSGPAGAFTVTQSFSRY